MDDNDDILIVSQVSPATDGLARLFNWLGLFSAIGVLGWVLLQGLA